MGGNAGLGSGSSLLVGQEACEIGGTHVHADSEKLQANHARQVLDVEPLRLFYDVVVRWTTPSTEPRLGDASSARVNRLDNTLRLKYAA